MTTASNLGRTLIIVNPVAQSGGAATAAAQLRRFLGLYCHDEGAFELVETERAGHATDIARSAAGYDSVLALGGDGVVHEVANGLMGIDAARRPALGVLPVGSGNDFARTLGIDESSGADFSRLLTYERTPLDILRIECDPGADGEGPRTLHAVETVSFGLDAAIAIDTYEVRRATGLTGAPLYTLCGLRAFGRSYRDHMALVSIDGSRAREVRAIFLAIQNGPTYGSGFRICPDADPADGLMDICHAPGPVPRAIALPVFLSAKTGRHVHSRHIRMQRARRIELTFPGTNQPIQVDGERLSAQRLAIEVVPRALTVLAPRRGRT
ncbi:MAG: diacylglycerol kinase family protein [Collinsella sp.]|nr:diacylglycerol kinase family protein [Collinsella sp.]